MFVVFREPEFISEFTPTDAQDSRRILGVILDGSIGISIRHLFSTDYLDSTLDMLKDPEAALGEVMEGHRKLIGVLQSIADTEELFSKVETL